MIKYILGDDFIFDIKENQYEKKLKIKDVQTGYTFEYIENYFIKIDEIFLNNKYYNCVNLLNGKLCHFESDCMVKSIIMETKIKYIF